MYVILVHNGHPHITYLDFFKKKQPLSEDPDNIINELVTEVKTTNIQTKSYSCNLCVYKTVNSYDLSKNICISSFKSDT